MNCVLWIVSCLLAFATADCLLLTGDCLLHLRGVRAGGPLGPHPSLRQYVTLTGKEETLVTLKMKERCRNVHENKGPAFSRPGEGGNVTENTGSWAVGGRWYVVDGMWYVVGGRWGRRTGSGCQVSGSW